jgi:hypothetical protein
MSDKLKITPGPWKVMYSHKDHQDFLAVWTADTKEGTIGSPICKVSPHHSETETDRANAELIAEAGTVTNESGYTPKELLEQRDELVEALEGVMRVDGFHLSSEGHKIIKTAIHKATKVNH